MFVVSKNHLTSDASSALEKQNKKGGQSLSRSLYLADGLRMRVEVDGVVVLLEAVVPPRLDVRDLHGVTDRLDVARGRAGLRTEERRNPRAEEVAD